MLFWNRHRAIAQLKSRAFQMSEKIVAVLPRKFGQAVAPYRLRRPRNEVTCAGAKSCSQTLHIENWAVRFHGNEVRLNIHRPNVGAIESDPPWSIEYPVLEPEENIMLNLSSRMKLPTSLMLLAALASIGAAALSTPASAKKWSQATSVEAVCKRTQGCWTDTGNGNTLGCGVGDGKGHSCFLCDDKKGKCYFFRKSAVEGKRRALVGVGVGNMSPGLLDGGGSLSTNGPSGTGKGIGGSSRGAAGAAVR
jgi:hypothetical protein